MHLFIVSSDIVGNQITLTESRILHHAKVMRLAIGEHFLVQEQRDNIIYRRTVVCTYIGKKKIVGTIVDTAQKSKKTGPLVVTAVPLPNTLSKLDLMVQKLTEIGVDKIILRTTERSQIRKVSDNKMSKLCQIVLESSQQAKLWEVPELFFTKNMQEYTATYIPIVCDQGGSDPMDLYHQVKKSGNQGKKGYICMLGPEGGLTHEDYICIGDIYIKVDMGQSILRMETAAIVGSRFVKNMSN